MILTEEERPDEKCAALARFATLGEPPPSYPEDGFLSVPGPSAFENTAPARQSAPDLHAYPPESARTLPLPTPPPSAPPRTSSAPESHRRTRTQSTPARVPLKALLDAPVVNGVFISSRNEPIEGSWRIDPELTMVGTPPKSTKGRPKRVQKAMAPDPNITLDSRGGTITARFSVIGRSVRRPMKANVRVTTKSGLVHVDMKEKSPGRYIDLDIYSKTGTSTVLLPKTFSGVIELHSRKGKIEVLEALSKHSRILKLTNEEVLLFIDQMSAPDAGDASQLADYVHMNSESGIMRIGFTVEDDKIVPVVGFWKKLGMMLRGGSAEGEDMVK